MEADFLILSDSAQVVGDKLYMLGGGWRVIRSTTMPFKYQMAVSAGVLVEWPETNQRHRFGLEIRARDGGKILATMDGEFEQGQPAGVMAGSTQRVLMSFTIAPEFESGGVYDVRFSLDGAEARRSTFTVVDQSRRSAAPGT